MITLFHRLHNDPCDGPCDVANVSVFTIGGVASGYIGSVWGEHIPEQALRFHHCEPDDVDDVLSGWGLTRRPTEGLGGQA